jgi:Xaa-Pro dipeptidase
MDVSRRLEKIRLHMDREQMDALVVLQPAAIQYLTNFKATAYSRPIILTVTHDREVLIVPGLEEIHAAEITSVSEIRVYYEHPDEAAARTDPRRCLLDLIGSLPRRHGMLGIEAGVIPYELATNLEKSGWKLKDAGREIVRLRERKDVAELDLIRKAGMLVSLGVGRSLRAARPGLPELEVEQVGHLAVIEQASRTLPGSVVGSISVTVAGKRAALPHQFTINDPIVAQELIIHSRQVDVDGYRAECERTYAIGDLSGRQEDIFQLAIEAEWAGIAAVRPGVPCSAIDETCREVIRKGGYAEYFIHRTGHGLGLEPHEAPYLRWDNDALLEPGMVLSVEPGIYVPGLGGARHSDTVLVTETGHELLTEFPRELQELTMRPGEVVKAV